MEPKRERRRAAGEPVRQSVEEYRALHEYIDHDEHDDHNEDNEHNEHNEHDDHNRRKRTVLLTSEDGEQQFNETTGPNKVPKLTTEQRHHPTAAATAIDADADVGLRLSHTNVL